MKLAPERNEIGSAEMNEASNANFFSVGKKKGKEKMLREERPGE